MLANHCSNNGDLRFNLLNSCILQICTKDKWTDICDTPGSNQWSENEVRVACYQWEWYGKKDQVLIVLV